MEVALENRGARSVAGVAVVNLPVKIRRRYNAYDRARFDSFSFQPRLITSFSQAGRVNINSFDRVPSEFTT